MKHHTKALHCASPVDSNSRHIGVRKVVGPEFGAGAGYCSPGAVNRPDLLFRSSGSRH